jgi:flagellin
MAISSISTNIQAQYTSNNIRGALDSLKASSIRLSSGKQITEARDDAAGLSIGTGLNAAKITLEAALKTSGQAMSVLAIADGGMDNISKILARMKSLASQANSGAMSSVELGFLQSEMTALIAQVDNIVSNTKFNGTKLLDGTYSAKEFQVGLTATDTIAVTLANAGSGATGLNISSADVTVSISAANTSIDAAQGLAKTSRANIGALQSRFAYASANLETSINNIVSAEALYLDADFARVSTEFSADQTKLQAGIATLAQVNQLPSNLLKLIS